MDPAIEEVLDSRGPAIGEVARRAVERLMALFPDAVVSVDGNDIGFGIAPGYKGLVFTLSPAKSYVTLGIAGGASLPDPAGLMEGAGKLHRHIKLRTPEDLDRPELATLLTAALDRHR
ncbi:DUF1801 domain-containing protein [Nonomuraea sp. NPDC050536]|uniref:DUF1801 domain-containing protein n=1 Tax=Nonomuraea sp. NPDC050536 TaxID=3364366 RepID=UPI0037C6C7E8